MLTASIPPASASATAARSTRSLLSGMRRRRVRLLSHRIILPHDGDRPTR